MSYLCKMAAAHAQYGRTATAIRKYYLHEGVSSIVASGSMGRVMIGRTLMLFTHCSKC